MVQGDIWTGPGFGGVPVDSRPSFFHPIPMKKKKTYPYPLALTPELKKEAEEIAQQTGMSQAEVLRQAARIGLPILADKLTRNARPGLVEALARLAA